MKKIVLIKILVPILIIVMISASFFKIVDAIKDIVTTVITQISAKIADKINQIGQFVRNTKNKIVNFFGASYYDAPGKLQEETYYIINEDEFQQISSQIDDAINKKSGGYTDIEIKKLLMTHYKGLCTSDTTILISVKSNLKEIIEDDTVDFSTDEGMVKLAEAEQKIMEGGFDLKRGSDIEADNVDKMRYIY